MSCKHCYHLARPVSTSFDDGLDQLLATLRGELGEGVLRETSSAITRHPAAVPAFESLSADGPWPERPVSLSFVCEFCGDRFRLVIDPDERQATWRHDGT